MLESEAAAIRMDLKRALIKIGEMESAMGKLPARRDRHGAAQNQRGCAKGQDA